MKRFLICIAIITTAVFSATAQNAMTLKQCIDTGIKNNLPVLQAQLQTERDAANWQQSKANLLPGVSGNFSYGGSQGRSIDPFTNSFVNQNFTNSNAGLSASIPVFNGFQLRNTIQQNRYTYEASKMDWQQAKDNLTLNIIINYLQVLNNEDVLDIARRQYEVSKKQVERLAILFREGATGSFNLSDLKGEMAGNQVAMVNAENNLLQSKLSLAQLMNIPYDAGLQLDRKEIDLNISAYGFAVKEIYEEALQKLAQIKGVDLRKQSSATALKVAKGSLWPSVSLGGSIGSNFSSAAKNFSLVNETFVSTENYVVVNGTQSPLFVKQQNFKEEPFGFVRQYRNNYGTQFGINVQVPILNSFISRNRIKQAKINFRGADLVAATTRIQILQLIEQAHQNMTAAYNRYAVLQQQVAAFEESFRAAEIRFTNGVINSAEYLLVKNNLDRTRINLTQAGYEYRLRTKVLDFYRGAL